MSTTRSKLRLSTPRLTLRTPRRADAPRIAELAGDFEVARMTSRLPHPYRREDADDFLAYMATADQAREQVFVVEHGQEGPIGMVGFHPGDSLGSEIGYWIGRPYWGRGFATEAARAALAWARDGWRRRAVVSGHFADNPASGRVLEKAGFLYTGRVEPRVSTARGEAAPTRMMVWLA
jgi:RimJ/RimL family protein N-acetyltransferase